MEKKIENIKKFKAQTKLYPIVEGYFKMGDDQDILRFFTKKNQEIDISFSDRFIIYENEYGWSFIGATDPQGYYVENNVKYYYDRNNNLHSQLLNDMPGTVSHDPITQLCIKSSNKLFLEKQNWNKIKNDTKKFICDHWKVYVSFT